MSADPIESAFTNTLSASTFRESRVSLFVYRGSNDGATCPASMISSEKLLTTCRKCHTTAGPNFAKYDPHADKHDKARNPVLFYAAGFMKWLLIGVFGVLMVVAVLFQPRGLVALFDRLRAGAGQGSAR